jgi:type IV secretion system protein VirB10
VIGKLPADYTFTIPPPSPPKPEPTKTEEEPEAAPIDPNLMKQLEALRREQETAMNSPIQFLNVHRSSEQQTKHGTDDEYSSQDIGYQASSSGSDLRFDAERREFFRDATKVETRVRSRFLPPRSPYEIKAGTILPAALITPINSDLPGDVVGQVTTNIYDWMSGRFLLVPQGSRLIGRYNSEVLKGQNRALIAWQRLILPNGYSIVLEAMPGTDAQGVAGMADQVDWHSRRIAGATLLSTLIALGGNYAANINPEQKEFSIVGETVAQDAARVGQRVIDRELDLRPTIVVRQGMPFNVLVTKDLELLPYQPVINQR